MIIPQIAENLTRSGVKDIPERCPVCQGETKIRQVGNAKALYCMNPECQAKHVKAFALFVSRDALNIEGLSEATLEKFISRGSIHLPISSIWTTTKTRFREWKDLEKNRTGN